MRQEICSAPFWYFQRAFAGFQLSDRHLSVIFFGEGWKSMTSLPPFLTLWILVEFAGSSDEDILMIKVRTKREKRSKTWSLRFDLLTIKMCTRDYKPWRLVLRCWCLTSMNHEEVCGGDREIFVSIIEGSLQFDLILLKLWNKITLSSRWPLSFKSLQITSSLLSLCCPIGYKALKKCSSFRIELRFLQPSANSFLGGWKGFSKSWLTTVFGLFALQVCYTWYVGMCLNNVHSLASIISGFI